MALQTRQPTGKPSWPMGLLAGVEKSGKSYACAQASASPVLGRTLWIGIGEDDPDEYGAVPGARFEIVEHDGSYQGILWAFRDAVSAPWVDGKPTLLVGDSMTRLWNLIVENAQAIANKRAKGRKKAGTDDYTVTADLWNAAAKQWKDVMDAVRAHKGPSLLTARLDEVAVMENGQPSGEKTWKVQGHKTLPFDVGFIVQMRERGQYLLTGTRSVTMGLQEPTPAPGWNAETMWKAMGVDPSTVGDRRHSEIVVSDDDDQAQGQQMQQPAAPRQQPAQVQDDRAEWVARLQQITDRSQINPLFAEIPKDHPAKQFLLQKFREHGAKLQQSAPPVDPGWAQPAQQAPQPPQEPQGEVAAPESAPEPSQVDSPASEGVPAAWAEQEVPPADGPSDDGDVPPEDEGAPMALAGLEVPDEAPAANGHTL